MNFLISFKYFPGYLILILVSTELLFCISYDFTITKVDQFPHNIDQDFYINIHHRNIKYHPIYAVIILQVEKSLLKEIQQIYIYPGYLPKLDRRVKEPYFHAMHFNTSQFNTLIIVRFYRAAQEGEFSIHYSSTGAENLHIEKPKDLMRIYKKEIHLYRPPVLKLDIQTEYGHKWGLSLNTRSLIICTSEDGFPLELIKITTDKPIKVLKKTVDNEYKVEMEFIAQLNDHLNTVICSSGRSIVTKQMKVFHRSQLVKIIPDSLSYVRQQTTLECKAIGEGYPESSVKWSVAHLNRTSEKYFTIFFLPSSKMTSYLTVNSIAPNNTQWQLNCSAMNIIPPLKHDGPFKLINITIGENPETAKLAASKMWTVSVVVLVLLLVFVIGILCVGSKVRCKSQQKIKSDKLDKKLEYLQVNEDETAINEPNSADKQQIV